MVSIRILVFANNYKLIKFYFNFLTVKKIKIFAPDETEILIKII